MAQRNVAGVIKWYNEHRTASRIGFNPDGMCLKLVRTARNIGAMYPSALKAQQATPAKYRITRIRDIRAGHVMYFDDPRDGNPFGHIVTVVGRVKGVSVDSLDSIVVETNSVKRGQVVRVRASYFPRHWGDRFVFASNWLNGVVLSMPKPSAPAPAPPPPSTSDKPIKTVFRGPTIDGVDISHHQPGTINYASAKRAGVKFLYHKVTEGTSFVDKNYGKRRAEAKAAGIPFGAYHFARPDAGDAKAEARFFIEKAKPVPGDLRPVLDLETRENLVGMPLVRWADEFCAEVKRLVGVWPIVYTPYTLSTELERACLFWVPRYNNQNEPPTRQWDIWQFSNGVYGRPNHVPGIGNVDINTVRAGLRLSDLLIPKRG